MLNQSSHDGQPQTGSAKTAIQTGIELVKLLKQGAQMLLCDADAAILHGEAT